MNVCTGIAGLSVSGKKGAALLLRESVNPSLDLKVAGFSTA
jgi:hypothetical protein